MSHSFKQPVLLIEADSALRRLISLGLQSRDIPVIEASSSAQLPDTLQHSSPALLILDIDSGLHSDWSLLAELQDYPELADLPAVVLTWDGVSAEEEARARTQALPCDRLTYVAKPFDARDLHMTVDELLAANQVAYPVAAPTVQVATFDAEARVAAPSLCPFITALGLMLAVAGSMINIAFCLTGIAIVVAALLWWTLDKKPATIEAREALLLPVAAGH